MVHARMERSGIWANGRVDLEEFLTCSWDEGWPIFCHFHLLVAEGKIARTEEQRDGQYVYRASELGKAHEAAAKLLKEQPACPMVQ